MTKLLIRDPFLAAPVALAGQAMRGAAAPSRVTGFTPWLDVREMQDGYLVLFDLPGVNADDVTIEVHDFVLTVSGARVPVETGEAKLVERPYGSFVRALNLPKDVDSDGITADFQNGVLELQIPKAPEHKPKRIAVGARKAIEK